MRSSLVLIVAFGVTLSNAVVIEDEDTCGQSDSGQGLQSNISPENYVQSEPVNNSNDGKKDLNNEAVSRAWFEIFLPEWKKIVAAIPLVGESRVRDHGTLGRTILHFLASQSDADLTLFQELLAFDPDINAADSYGQTPLHLAVIHNNLALVKILLEHGAVQCRNQAGSTPLHLALFLKNDEIASLLLQHERPVSDSGDIYISDDDDALHIAIHIDASESIFQKLLESGKGKNSLEQYEFGWRSVKAAFWRYPTSDSDPKTPPKAEAVGIVISNVGPLVHHAIFNCRKPLLQLLMTAGANMELKDLDGTTPLHLAAERCPDFVGILISAEVPVNDQNNLDQTVLHIAAKNGDETVVKALIDANASLVAKDNQEQTPIACADAAGYSECTVMLKDAVAEQAALELSTAEVFEAQDMSDHPIVLQEQLVAVEEPKQSQPESEQPTSNGYCGRACSSFIVVACIFTSFTIL